MTLGDLLGNASTQTPLLVLVAGVLVLIAGFIGKRAATSMQRQGARLGLAEIALTAETTRRRQVEQCLRDAGFPLPYWPDDPPQLYRAPAIDDAPDTEWMPTQDFSRHRLPRRTP